MFYFKHELPSRTTADEEKELFENWNEKSKQRMIEGNIRIAIHVAKKFEGTLDPDDLIGVSALALVKAADSFEPSIGTRFSTYAARVIENEILMALRRNKKSGNDISIYAPINTDGEGNEYEIWEVLGDPKPEKQVEAIENEDFIRIISEGLDDRERYVIAQWVDGVRQKNIADRLGITQPQVSRIMKRALRKMRERSESNGE